MSEEFNLDSLKEAWKTLEEKTFSSDEIFAMLKRKSSSSVKWVFIISLLELLSGIVLYILMFSNFSISDYHTSLLENMGYWGIIYEALTFLIYGVTFLFIYLFFNSYKKIRVQSSIKDLSKDIMYFRKIVNYYIYFNIAVLFVLMWVLFIPMINRNPDLAEISWTSSTGIGVIVGLLTVFLFIIGVYWLYYYVVYGTFLRRLKRNLNELEVLD